MALKLSEMQKRVGMRPTLLVGAGGTGQRVLVQLKARFIQNWGDVPSVVRFLCFDTDQNAEKTELNGQRLQLTADTELINIGGIETAQIVKNLDRHPSIAAWLAEDKDNVPLRAISQGAKQVRPLGRLSFFWRTEAIYRKLMEAIAALTSLREVDTENRGVNVFLVSSVCGGTGSGSILDLAYLTRLALQKSGLDSQHYFINGVLVLPSAFPNVDKVGIESNAFAALNEVDYYMGSMVFKQNYGTAAVPEIDMTLAKPFNICYLIDSRNEDGLGLTGMEEVAPMIAEAIYLQISSQVGAANASVFDNVDTLDHPVTDPSGKARPNAYSSFGTATLVFPARKIIETCANRLGRDLLQNYILRSAVDEKRVEAAISAFLQSAMLEPDTLLQQVGRDAKNELLRIMINPQALDQLKESDLFAGMTGYLQREERKVDDEFYKILETNRGVVADNLSKRLVDEVNRLVDDPAFGLLFSAEFLRRLDERLAKTRQDLDRQRQELDTRHDRASSSQKAALDALNQAFRSGPFGKSGKIRAARDNYVNIFRDALTTRFESKKREVAISALATLSAVIQTRQQLLKQTVDRLSFIQVQCDKVVKDVASGKQKPAFILTTEITDVSDMDKYFSEHFTTLGSSPLDGLLNQQGPFHEWIGLDQGKLSERLLTYTRSVFQDINEISIEQVIAEKRNEVEENKRLQDLINRSVPFWMIQPEELGSYRREAKITVIGVPETENSLFVGFVAAEGQTRLTSTFNKHEITVLQTKHGAPLFGLKQYNDYKTNHDYVLRNNIKLLYVFPEVRPGGEKAKQIFALGIAYGFIFKSGVYYYVMPVDPSHNPPFDLDRGMGESLRKFRGNDDLIKQVEKMAESEISKQGTRASYDILQGFVDKPFVYEIKNAKRLNITREEMTQDTSIFTPGGGNFELMQELVGTIQDYIKRYLRG